MTLYPFVLVLEDHDSVELLARSEEEAHEMATFVVLGLGLDSSFIVEIKPA